MTTYAKTAVQKTGIRIVHSLAVLHARFEVDDQQRHGPPPGHPAGAPKGIYTDDPAYYSVVMAMGKRRDEAAINVGGHGRPAAHTSLRHLSEKLHV
jgi:hypothetical protein